MPKPKSKTSKSKLSRENTPLEPLPEKEKPKEPPELPWSDWIWDADQTIYYRAKLGADKIWQYEYATVPAPTPLILPLSPPSTPLSGTPLIKCTKEDLELKVYDPKPTVTETYVSSSLPIKCTKEDFELKVMLEPEPCWTYDVRYTVGASGDLRVEMPVDGAVGVAGVVKAKPAEGIKVDKQEESEKKEQDDKKKELEKAPRPNTPKKSHKARLHSMEKVEAYIEGLEPGKRKERHTEKTHKHYEKKEESIRRRGADEG